jgi:hypothetical protein
VHVLAPAHKHVQRVLVLHRARRPLLQLQRQRVRPRALVVPEQQHVDATVVEGEVVLGGEGGDVVGFSGEVSRVA